MTRNARAKSTRFGTFLGRSTLFGTPHFRILKQVAKQGGAVVAPTRKINREIFLHRGG